MSTPVVLVAGLHGMARTTVVDRLLRERPGAVAIHHDLRSITSGLVTRTVRSADARLEQALVRLEHGCVTCTVREDLIPRLIRYAGPAELLVVDLWDSVEPRSVAEALDHPDWDADIRITGVLTAVDPELMPADICRGESLTEAGKPSASGDQRYVAEVLAHQIEYATALVVPQTLLPPMPPADEEDLDLCRELLAHLAAMTPVTMPGEPLPPLTGPALCARELAARVDPATAQLPCRTHTPAADTVVWHRTTPLHPARFFDAMDTLATESVRSRGRFWLANRPDRMLAWDAVAGIVTVEDTGPWLAAVPDADWDTVPPARRLAAAMDWSAEQGDRVQHLVFTGPALDQERLDALLDGCLLEPGESATGLDDPFADLLDLDATA
ncbi:CobW family GTP-binding protein [Actinomadura sp. LOL_016]|uniref:CobW family GTP-binding protein n=1 Tax=unclassified Actinomadura TaxID=2626254 RepID=UPI003A8064D0